MISRSDRTQRQLLGDGNLRVRTSRDRRGPAKLGQPSARYDGQLSATTMHVSVTVPDRQQVLARSRRRSEQPVRARGANRVARRGRRDAVNEKDLIGKR